MENIIRYIVEDSCTETTLSKFSLIARLISLKGKTDNSAKKKSFNFKSKQYYK